MVRDTHPTKSFFRLRTPWLRPQAALRVTAFILERGTARTLPVMSHLVAVDQVERRSNLHFFWQVPDTDENAMEAAIGLPWAQNWFN